MTEAQHERIPIERPELQRLFTNWLIQLLDERYGVKARGASGAVFEAQSWNVTLADDSMIQVKFDRSGQSVVQGPDGYEGDLASIVEGAHRRTLALDYGTGAWWKVSFLTDMSNAGLMGVWNLHFVRLMSEHN